MRIALIQQPASDDRAANRRRGLDAVARAAQRGAKLICFSELAFEPFYPQEPASREKLDLAESIPGPTTELFAAQAAELGVVVVLNLFEREGNRHYNSSPVFDADGTILGTTRMVHITDYPCFHELGYYSPGDRGVPVFETAARFQRHRSIMHLRRRQRDLQQKRQHSGAGHRPAGRR